MFALMASIKLTQKSGTVSDFRFKDALPNESIHLFLKSLSYHTAPYPFFMLWVSIEGSGVGDEVGHFTLSCLDDTTALKLVKHAMHIFQRKANNMYLNFLA